MAARRHAADEHALVTEVRAHAHAIAKDGAARKRARGIDGDDADRLPGLADFGRHPIDERALAGARRPGDADHIRAARARIDVAHQPGAGGRFILDERDGARDRPRVAREHAFGERGRHLPINWRAMTSR